MVSTFGDTSGGGPNRCETAQRLSAAWASAWARRPSAWAPQIAGSWAIRKTLFLDHRVPVEVRMPWAFNC